MNEPLPIVIGGVVVGEFVRYSVAHEEDPDDDGRTVLHLDVYCDHHQLAKFMEMLAGRYDEDMNGGGGPGPTPDAMPERPSSDFTATEIAMARAAGKLRVDDEGLGWIRDMQPSAAGDHAVGQIWEIDDWLALVVSVRPFELELASGTRKFTLILPIDVRHEARRIRCFSCNAPATHWNGESYVCEEHAGPDGVRGLG